jgi:hypothetical protein
MNSLWVLGLQMVDSNSLWLRYESMVVGVTNEQRTSLTNMSFDTHLLLHEG